jgi:magnesium chelatase family protein
VRRVRGVLPALLAARAAGRRRAIVPACQEDEARLVEGLEIWGVANLDELVEALNGRPVLPGRPADADSTEPIRRSPVPAEPLDLADVVGQPEGRWALEVAAAGGHHLFLHGAPGLGKTMLAMRLPGLLPPLDTDAALEVSALHSLAGEDLGAGLIGRPPFADPHYNATLPSMVGGGSRLARPGAISLAHRGVLFLDEAPEFSPRVLDALRTPLESGTISIARSQGIVRFPARFQLVLAANPCPCGQSGTPGAMCQCSPTAVRRYRERISGPIMDRIDIHQQLLPVRAAVARALDPSPEPTATVAQRVAAARERSRHRLSGTAWTTNAEVPGGFVRKSLPAPCSTRVLDEALAKGRISARGVDKVARIAWTLADLSGHDLIDEDDLAAAMGLHGDRW